MTATACGKAETSQTTEISEVNPVQELAPEEDLEITTEAGLAVEVIEEEAVPLLLNFEDKMPFVIDEASEIGTYHDSLVKLVIEDEEVIEALFTGPELQALRTHLEAYGYNTDPGVIGMVSQPDSLYVLCNKLNRLPADYEPSDLVEPDVAFSFSSADMKRHLRQDAATALEALFAAGEEAGVSLTAVSGYRSYDRQNTIYTYNVNTRGVEETDKVSARPGHSEHQTGLAMDVSCGEVNYGLVEEFGETKEGIWLKEHAHEYGFIIRYQEYRVDNTGYSYEPWHLRYIGEDLAGFAYEHDLTLEMIYSTLQRTEEE